MIKTLTIFKNIEDLNALLKFYTEEVYPAIHKIPGIICTDLTSISHISPDISKELNGIELIMETHFESEEAMQRLVFSDLGNGIMMKTTQVTPCEVSVLMGKEKRFSGEMTDSLRQTIARIGHEVDDLAE
ncbi:hypothetical protein [Shimazuella kribbensis]|uniref:hypothetical protein n=1 Tax=Shimazuella kribbensis TaxID=139808 RepID=UPI000402B61B|nr:hypothetical protein [Shimazuella kribbensis]